MHPSYTPNSQALSSTLLSTGKTLDIRSAERTHMSYQEVMEEIDNDVGRDNEMVVVEGVREVFAQSGLS